MPLDLPTKDYFFQSPNTWYKVEPKKVSELSVGPFRSLLVFEGGQYLEYALRKAISGKPCPPADFESRLSELTTS